MIEVQGLGFRYGERAVLDGVSFTVESGQLYGVLGPNGSGKTTLLRLMLAFLRPTSGRVMVEGRELSSYGRRELARVMAAVPQESPVEFPFTVSELVMMGRTPHLGLSGIESEADARAAQVAMERCGIVELASRPIHALSGGELRRVFIARALAQEGRVLLLDEPTAGLDIHHQIAIFEVLKAEARAGKTVVTVVHDLNLAAAYCDRLLLLSNGRSLAEGKVEEVLTYRLVRECYGVDVYVGVNEVTGARFLIPMAGASK